MYWGDAVVKWLDETSNKKTHSDDISALRFAHPYLEGKFLDEITRAHMDELTEAKKATGVKNATVNRMLEVIRAILNRAVKEWEWVDKTPSIRMLPEAGRRVRWLTHIEAERLLLELSPHLNAMARFSLATGLREANVYGLEWSQVDLQRKVAWIHADQTKAKKAIGVPLNTDAIEVLREQVGKHLTRVFTYKGKPVGTCNTASWRKALKRAGIDDFRWHDLRHTWASWHVQAGTPLNVLQELGSWSDIRMVQRYAHLAPEHLAKHANRIVRDKGVSENVRTLSGTPSKQEIKTAQRKTSKPLILLH
jgi:integrase